MKKRPLLVWAISIFYFATGLWYLPTLYNLAVATINHSSIVASLVGPPEWIALIGLVAVTILSFSAAYSLFLLKHSSVLIFGALLGLGVIYDLTKYGVDSTNLSATAISATVVVLSLRAVLWWYVWRLSKKGILS